MARISLAALASTVAVLSFAHGAAAEEAAKFPEPLPAEEIPAVETLPADYPDSWMFVHDFNFNSMVDARLAVVDLLDEKIQLKGNVPASHFAHFLSGRTSKELYVAETYYTRMVRGERQDVITIYDRDTLAFKDEIALPGGKRAQMIQLPNNFQFANDEKWALVFNFTPASSVRIVDLKAREILNEIDVPGCMLTFPTGQRSFSTMCSDGTLSTITLKGDGSVAGETTSQAFNDIDDDPLYMFPTQQARLTHFVSFSGEIQPIDFSGEKPKIGERWSMLDESTKDWRPGGWQVISRDDDGHIYVLMQPDAGEGSHKNGGVEVWVFDAAKQERVNRIKLKDMAWSIGVSAGKKPLLVAASLEGFMQVYDAKTGAHIRKLSSSVTYNPVAMFPVP